MATGAWSWEPRLWEMAMVGSGTDRSLSSGSISQDQADLDVAFDLADQITRQHSRSFHLASGLLPRPARRAIRSLYAFCRFTDDIVDNAGDQGASEALDAWQAGNLDDLGEQAVQVMAAWQDTQVRYAIPQGYADQLIAGVRMDISHDRYHTFDDLAAYSYRVASTVGLMSMHILGFQSTDAVPYAVKMGVALQLTNILRDVGEDWQMGRLYLPQDELEDFGIVESDIDNGRLTPAWRRYMRFAIDRNRQLYEQAWPGLELLSPQGRRSVGAAAELYRGILDAIESLDYDVFRHRAYLNRWEKIRRLSRVLTPVSLWGSTQDQAGQPATGNMSRRAEDRGLLGERVPSSSTNA